MMMDLNKKYLTKKMINFWHRGICFYIFGT